MWFVGIDVSNATLDVAVRSTDGEVVRRKAKNSCTGHPGLSDWLRCLPAECVVVEATSSYHRKLVTCMQARGLHVSVVDPALANDFVKSQHRRNKTDSADAFWLAVFARERRTAVWGAESHFEPAKPPHARIARQDPARPQGAHAASE